MLLCKGITLVLGTFSSEQNIINTRFQEVLKHFRIYEWKLVMENLIFKMRPPFISQNVASCLVGISLNILGVIKGTMEPYSRAELVHHKPHIHLPRSEPKSPK